MMTIKSFMRASLALAAMCCSICIIAGCGKEESAIAPSSPESYMHDKAFLDKLKVQDTAKRALMTKLVKAREEIEAAKAKGADEKTLKALDEKLKDLEREHAANRAATQALVRERITRKKNLQK